MSIKFDTNTAAAKQLSALVFAKLKEFWDPNLEHDDPSQHPVAMYTVALAASGKEEKKIIKNLKGIVGDGSAKMLAEWLLKYIKQHQKELTSAKPEPAGPKKPEKTSPAVESRSTERAQQKQQPEQQPVEAVKQEVAEITDVDGLLREGMEEEYYGQEGEQDTDVQDTQAAAAPDGSNREVKVKQETKADRKDSLDRHESGRIKTEAGSHDDRRREDDRKRSSIQWRATSSDGEKQDRKGAVTKESKELEARRARFGKEAHRDDRDKDRSIDRRDRERSADRDLRSQRSREDRERGRGRSRSRSPMRRDRDYQRGRREWDMGKDFDVDRGLRRSPPRFEGRRSADMEHDRRHGPVRSYVDLDRFPQDRSFGPMRRTMGGDDRYEPFDDMERPRVDDDRYLQAPRDARALSPEQPARLRSQVVVEERNPDDAGPSLDAGKFIERTMGATRLLGKSLFSAMTSDAKSGSVFSRLTGRRNVASAAVRTDIPPPQPEPQSSDSSDSDDDEDDDTYAMGGAQLSIKALRSSVFDRLSKWVQRPTVPLVSHKLGAERAGTTAKRQARHDDDGDDQEEDARPAIRQRRTEEASQQPASGPAQATATASQLQQSQTGAVQMTQPLQQQPMPPVQLQPQAAQQLSSFQPSRPGGSFAGGQLRPSANPFRPSAGVTSPQGHPFTSPSFPMPSINPFTAPPQPVAAPPARSGAAVPGTGAAQPSRPATAPLSATAAATRPTTAATAAAAGSGTNGMSEMEKLMAELKRKEVEIKRMKGAIAAQQGGPRPAAGGAAAVAKAAAAEAAAKRAEADSRSVLVQNLHFGATDDMLIAHFTPCGPIARITILRDMMTQRPYGAAYVEFSTAEARTKALTLTGSTILDQGIKVVPKTGSFRPVPSMGLGMPGMVPGGGPVSTGFMPSGAKPVGSASGPGPMLSGGAVLSRPQANNMGMPSIIPSGMPPVTGLPNPNAAFPMPSITGAMPGIMPSKKLSETGPLKSGSMVWRRPDMTPANAAGSQTQA